MTRFTIATFVVLGSLCAAPVLAADIAAGKARSDEICADCHGDEGYGDDTFPSIVGMPVEEFAKAMQEYKDGTRDNKKMMKIAKQLSDADVANLAAYFAQFKPAN